MNAFGNAKPVLNQFELCGWGTWLAPPVTPMGVGSGRPGAAGSAMADIAHTGCLVLWGYNPSMTRG